jgi:glycerophosphoryl diester phosphodiesterase
MKIIAHRGFSGRFAENTMPAIQAALGLGVDMVEVDVHETCDGELAVFHDYRLDRLCGTTGRVRDTTLAQMRRLNSAIPTLPEVLSVCRGRAQVLIEIKRACPLKVASAVAAMGMQQQVVVFALSINRIQRFAAASPEICRFALVARELPVAFPVPIEGIGASRRLITSQAVVDRIHQQGLKLFVWTVNRRVEMERLAGWGVDGLITNHPDRAKSVLARR